jgi:CMP-N-acetylneuraminic acid synthetase
MINGMTVNAMIPSRLGSQRLARKNIALIAGKPMVSYAIEAAKACPYFDKIIVSTNDPKVKTIAGKLDVQIYDRKEEHANSEARSDEVVKEFIEQFPSDIIAWVNTTSPLQPHGEIKAAIEHFCQNDLDTLFTVYPEKVHCNFKNKGMNYFAKEKFSKTQDIEPIDRFVYSVMLWRTKAFLKNYNETGNAFFTGKIGTFPVSKLTSLLIKNIDDLMIADAIASFKADNTQYELNYYKG